MSALFWVLAGSMVIAAVAFIVLPLWRGARPAGAATSAQVDVALYRQRRVELDRERETGLLTKREHGLALAELDRQLLADTEDAGETAVKTDGRSPARWPAAVAAVLVPALAVGLYLEIGGGGEALHTGARQQAGPQSIEAMVRRLETRLRDNPDNGEGWLMLGRSYAVMGRPQEAVEALGMARRLLDDDPEVLVEYAQALAAVRGGESLAGRPAELVDLALEKAPNHPRALWLSGLAAAERGDYRIAAARWQRLLAQQAPNSESARLLQQSLEAVRARLEDDDAGAVTTASTAEAPAAASVRVHVSLAPELRDRVDADDTVFIFARAPGGPPMPLAVVRRRVGDLPATVTLDDGDALMPGPAISARETVAVVARVSRSGDATARPGDLEAQAHTAAVTGGDTVSLVIDSIVGDGALK
jgi:cytochrome c-type biogenesis protein CcmH